MQTTIYVENRHVSTVRNLLEPLGNIVISRNYENPALPTSLIIQFEKITNLQEIHRVAKKYGAKNFKKTDLIKK